jgi:MraZ protein
MQNTKMSVYFKGSETHSLDSKGRVAIPAKMRKQIAPEANGTFVVTRGVDKCIVCYPLDEWEEYSKNMSHLNMFNPKERYVINVMNMWMDELEMDGQSRIKLPAQLLEFAGVKDKVRIIGMINHLALWEPEEHDAYIARLEEEQPYELAVQQVFEMKPDE